MRNLDGRRALHGQEIRYPRSEAALRHGAGVESDTSNPQEAYEPFTHWQPRRPATWEGLPWALGLDND